MADIELQKDVLRKNMMVERNKLSPAQVRELSRKIAYKLWQLEPIRMAKVIMGFASIRNEVDLTPFMEQAGTKNKVILLPRIGQGGEMEAVEFRGWEYTAKGRYGIREPLGKPYAAENIDAVLVPGLVFDGNGYRLGYGKGYYDRFLKLLGKSVFICGVCYEFQLVENVFPHESDIPMHWIVTDKSELAINWDYF